MFLNILSSSEERLRYHLLVGHVLPYGSLGILATGAMLLSVFGVIPNVPMAIACLQLAAVSLLALYTAEWEAAIRVELEGKREKGADNPDSAVLAALGKVVRLHQIIFLFLGILCWVVPIGLSPSVPYAKNNTLLLLLPVALVLYYARRLRWFSRMRS